MKKGKIFFSAVTFIFFLNSMALANGLNLNSLGTRALAMGGAFVGLADDFSAVYWNPAGIAQFDRKYFGFYGTDIIPSSTFNNPLVDAKSERKHYLSGLAAYYHPVSENVVVGIGVYIPSGLGAKWNGDDLVNLHPVSMGAAYEWMSKIGLVTIAPSIAYKINEQISVGAALNINYGIFNLKMHGGSEAYGVDIGQYDESMKGWGYGATFGVLVKLSEMFSLGATFRTANKVKFSGEAEISNLDILGTIPGSPFFGVTLNTKSNVDRDVTWPMWLAGGVAFKPIENLVLTGDLQWTQWSKIGVIETDFKDTIWQIMMAASGDDQWPMNWKNVLQIRFGAEYRINTIAIRAGYYWDPSPAPDRTMNVLIPSYDFNVVTVGFGYALNGLQLDFSVEYLMGKERVIGAENLFNMQGTYSQKIFVPNISISYKF